MEKRHKKQHTHKTPRSHPPSWRRREALTRQDAAVQELLVVRRVPAAYKQCLAECVRRWAPGGPPAGPCWGPPAPHAACGCERLLSRARVSSIPRLPALSEFTLLLFFPRMDHGAAFSCT